MVRRPSLRARIAQWVFLTALVVVAVFLASNAADNLSRRHIAFGFGYLANTANFDIPFRLIDFGPDDTYARALLVCVLNTLLVSAMGIVAATLIGLLIGLMRLSSNWLIRNMGLVYVELVRNTPILVQIIFWYVAVLHNLPGPRQSLHLPAGVLLNVRGFYLPMPVMGQNGPSLTVLALALLVATPVVARLTIGGSRLVKLALAMPLLAILLFSAGIEHIDTPSLTGFNVTGGVQLPPELAALWAGLSIYSGAFIAEIVRSSVQAVSEGQREAARSIGLKPRLVLLLVVLPQALRMMVPPLTSQYLNLIKSSSLGAAVAYPEIFQIFAGTVLNKSGREIETFAIVMAIFLSINLAVSAAMNAYNRRVMLVTAR
ncbi:MAG: ABC transporter permease subunit [Hyphomicrobiales bacterium]|nr:ABC transporter permease subunit [Hyphomicrobiales bacterium]